MVGCILDGKGKASLPTVSKTGTNEMINGESGSADGAGPGTGAGQHVVSRGHSRSVQALEARTQEIGRELFERIGRGPKPWQRAWWEERFIAATLDDPLVRVQLFRFIDALPALQDRPTRSAGIWPSIWPRPATACPGG